MLSLCANLAHRAVPRPQLLPELVVQLVKHALLRVDEHVRPELWSRLAIALRFCHQFEALMSIPCSRLVHHVSGGPPVEQITAVHLHALESRGASGKGTSVGVEAPK